MELVPAAVVVAVVAAVRSTWSPCGWSMLSTLTPLSERSRGHRFAPTAAWFVTGAALGGTLLGTLGALAAWAVHATGASAAVRLIVAAAAVAVGVAFDAGLARPSLPHHRRQVDEDWLDEFRPWVYGGGFGLQIGAGLATYIMTTGVYLVVALGALTATPAAALALGALFGTTRGLAILSGSRLTDPTRLARFHQRFATLDAPVRRATTVTLAGVAVAVAAQAGGASAAAGGVIAGTVAIVALVAMVAAAQRGATRMRPTAPLTSVTNVERRTTEPTTA